MLNRTLAGENGNITTLLDLKTQVAQWLRFERKQYTSNRMREKEKRGTIFTVWFSLWDISYHSQLDNDDALEAIRQSIDALFKQLGVIADSWPLGTGINLAQSHGTRFPAGMVDEENRGWGIRPFCRCPAQRHSASPAIE